MGNQVPHAMLSIARSCCSTPDQGPMTKPQSYYQALPEPVHRGGVDCEDQTNPAGPQPIPTSYLPAPEGGLVISPTERPSTTSAPLPTYWDSRLSVET